MDIFKDIDMTRVEIMSDNDPRLKNYFKMMKEREALIEKIFGKKKD